MDRVTDGVYQIGVGANAFVVDGDEGVVLIDTGLPGKEGPITAGLTSIGRSLPDVSAILLTHGHSDHTGNVAWAKSESGGAVFISSNDAKYLRGTEPPPPPPMLAWPLLEMIVRLVPDAPVLEPDVELAGSMAVPGWEGMSAVATPGHTPGHLSYLLDRGDGVLFAGDSAMCSRSGKINRGFMNRKSIEFDASLRATAVLEFDVACFGHSNAIVGGAGDAFRRLVESW